MAITNPNQQLAAPGAALDAALSAALTAATSANTRRLYRSQARVFAAWCQLHGLQALPATPETVARYLTARAEAGAVVGTVRAARAAIGALHRAAGAADPASSELVRTAMRGLARQHGAPQRQATALTAEGLAAIIATAYQPRRRGRGRETVRVAMQRGAQDCAIAGLLFLAGLRRAEVAALRWADIAPATTPGALLIHTRKTKTDQTGEQVDIRLVKGPAAAALRTLRGTNSAPEDLVFRLNPESIGRRLAAAARAAGLQGDYTGHSGRVGLASELTRHGASMQEVMLAGGWRSAGMVARYSAGVAVEAGAVAKYL